MFGKYRNVLKVELDEVLRKMEIQEERHINDLEILNKRIKKLECSHPYSHRVIKDYSKIHGISYWVIEKPNNTDCKEVCALCEKEFGWIDKKREKEIRRLQLKELGGK